MKTPRLDAFEAVKREERAERAEREKARDFKRAVREALPASVKVKLPKRPRGRTAAGGISRREVAELRAMADRIMKADPAERLRLLTANVQRTTLVILLMDGLVGTEPWRVARTPHGGLMSANARARYLENAARVLDDIRQMSRGQEGPRLLEGVVDAEPADKVDGATAGD